MTIQPGKYRARSTGTQDVSFGVSTKGNLQVAVLFEFLDEELGGQTISWIGTFGEGRSTEITIQALENCGWVGDDPTVSLDGIDANEVLLVVENDQNDKGEIYPRVKWVNRPGSGRVKFRQPVDGADLRVWGPDIKSVVRARRAEQGQPQRPAASSTGTRTAAPSASSGGQRQMQQRPAAQQQRRPAQQPRPQADPNPDGPFNDDDYPPPGTSDDDFPF